MEVWAVLPFRGFLNLDKADVSILRDFAVSKRLSHVLGFRSHRRGHP
jgi:hypothetical protein